jgi:quercetin dioxygenase-like cupin family protein
LVLFVALTLSLPAVVAAGQRSTTTSGFAELHRAQLSDANSVELIMGLIERDGESKSGKHYHPGGEFGLVLSGAMVIATQDGAARTLEAGDSFYQPPGEWHVVSTGAPGAKTVVFRVVESGQPMVVPVE